MIMGCWPYVRGDSVRPSFDLEGVMVASYGIFWRPGTVSAVAARLVSLLAVLLLLVPLPGRADAVRDPLDTTFQNPNLNGVVQAVAVQSDGRIVVGGNFTTAGGGNQPSSNLARFLADGSLDPSFAVQYIDGEIYAIAIQSDGKILIGGSFRDVNNLTRHKAARLESNGDVDVGFDPNFDDNVWAIAVDDQGRILFGGDFMTAGGEAHNFIARYSDAGVVDSAFTAPVPTTVFSIAVTSGGKIVAGGGSFVDRFNADGTQDTGFLSQTFNGSVYKVALQDDGKILAGGSFTTVGATNRSRIARLNVDGSADPSFANTNLGGDVRGLAIQADGKVVVTGAFRADNGPSAPPRNYLLRLTGTGALDLSFGDPSLNNGGRTVVLQQNGNILVGGDFTAAGANGYGRLARFLWAFFNLSVTAPANGTVTGSLGGIDCGTVCSAQLGSGTSVTLTAIPATGYVFAGWGGGCAGTTNPLTVTPSADLTCTASFTASGGGAGGGTMPPPAPPPGFVSAPVTAIQNVSTVGAGTGSLSLAASFTNPQALTFTAARNSGAPLPSWLTFNPSTVSFAYDVPIPSDLPIQPLADAAADGRAGRADARASWANTIYPVLIRVAQVPVTLTVTGAGQRYVSTIQMNFYAPRSPVAISAVSLSLDGARGNGRSGRSALSWDGGQMVFETAATNIFPASANGFGDIVRYQALSGDRDRLSQTAIPGGGVANAADGASMSPAVSSDGLHAAFASNAPSVSMTPNGGMRQVYRTALGYPRVPLNGAVTPAPDMVSVTAGGIVGNAASDNPALSQDGRYVAFESMATNFGIGVAGQRRIWRKDMQTGALEPVSIGTGNNPSISWDGRYVAFDDGAQVYLRDMTGGQRTIAPGTRPRLTARADRIAFVADGQVMLADVTTGAVRAVTAGNGISDDPAISADGRFVVFRSAATNLVSGLAGNGLVQIFVRDVERGVTALVTQTASGGPGNGASWSPALSGDGGTISFASDARDLVNGNPAAGQAYLAANPLPLPAKTGYWTMPSVGGGQGWVMERWGARAYVGGLAYDGQGRSQWLAGYCTLSGLTCSGRLDAAGASGPAFSLVTAETGTSAILSVGSAPPQALAPFAIGGIRTTGFAGLPQAGWWYEAGAGNNVGYFLAIDTQPQPDGSVAHIGYLSVLAYDAAGRPAWQSAQAALGDDLSFSGILMQYAGGAPFGAATAAIPASASIVGPVRLSFDGTEKCRIALPDGRIATLSRFRF